MIGLEGDQRHPFPRCARLDNLRHNAAAAWYEEGREDPSLLMLRLDLHDAEIREADPGLVGLFKMVTGITIQSDEMGDHAKVAL